MVEDIEKKKKSLSEQLNEKEFLGVGSTTGVTKPTLTKTPDINGGKNEDKSLWENLGGKISGGVNKVGDVGTSIKGGLSNVSNAIDTKTSDIISKMDTKAENMRYKLVTDDKGNVVGERSQAAIDALKAKGVIPGADAKPLTTQEKAYQAQADLTESLQNKAVIDQMDYAKKYKETEEYMKSQRSKEEQYDELEGKSVEINRSANLDASLNKLNNIKQNLAYIGTRGTPGVSSVKLDAVGRQIEDAQRSYNDMVTLEQNASQMIALGMESKSEAFERQMTLLQDDLDSKVNDVLQNAINDLNSAEIAGKFDTLEEVNALREQVLDSIDTSVEGITNGNIQRRQALLDNFNDLIKDQKEVAANKNTINKEMSVAQGFYVDGNGQPIVSATTGGIIRIPEEAPMDPVFDKESGRLITFTKDATGNIVANVDQVIDQPTFESETISNYASLVASGRLDIEDVPENVRNTSTFVDALSKAPTPDVEETPLDKAKRLKIEAETGQIGVPKDETPSEKLAREKFEFEKTKYRREEGIETDYGTMDISTDTNLINKYPNEAAFKNNNPTGITRGVSNDLKGMWDEAGVSYEIGTSRPKTEGGNYVKFATVDDGMKAYMISLTGRGDDIYSRLKKWVGTDSDANNTAYANELMRKAGISKGEKFSTLDKEKLNNLVEAQLKKESPNFFKEVIYMEAPRADIATEDLEDIATDVVFGRITVNELDNLGYTDNEIKQIEKLRKEKLKEIPDSYILDPIKKNDWGDKQFDKFRKIPAYTKYDESSSKYQEMKALIDIPGGPADVAQIFLFMKAFDPTSVVRESEYASALDSLGLSAKVKGSFTKALGDGFIPEDQEYLFAQTILAIDNIRRKNLLKSIEDYESRAKRRGFTQNEMDDIHGFTPEEKEELKTELRMDGSKLKRLKGDSYVYRDSAGKYYIGQKWGVNVKPGDEISVEEGENAFKTPNYGGYEDEDLLNELFKQ